MDKRIQKYFQDEMTPAERIAFLREVERDLYLRKEFIEVQNERALMNLAPETMNEAEGRAGYTRFLKRINRKRVYQFVRRTLSYAAVAAVVLVATYLVTNWQKEELPIAEMNILSVPAGQRAQITLQDGTEIWLNAQSTLTYPSYFGGKERKVTLVGEGYFNVTADKEKPFIVAASEIEIKVLGTQFNVYSYPETGFVQTSLMEGTVEVYEATSQTKSVTLKPNEEVIFRNGNMEVSKIKYQDAFLWKEGIYSFDNERLEDIVNKLELYYDIKIVIDDDKLKNVRYTCKFRQRDGIDEILQILRRIHNFKINRDREKNTITLS